MELSEWDLENEKPIINPEFANSTYVVCRFSKNDITFEVNKTTIKTGNLTIHHEVVLEWISKPMDVLSCNFSTVVEFTATSDKKFDKVAIENFLREFYLSVERFLRDVRNVPDKMISPAGHLIEAYRIEDATEAILSELTKLAFYQ